jgi:hypothetical protein
MYYQAHRQNRNNTSIVSLTNFLIPPAWKLQSNMRLTATRTGVVCVWVNEVGPPRITPNAALSCWSVCQVRDILFNELNPISRNQISVNTEAIIANNPRIVKNSPPSTAIMPNMPISSPIIRMGLFITLFPLIRAVNEIPVAGISIV